MNIIDTIVYENNKENRNEKYVSQYVSQCESYYMKQQEYTNFKNRLDPFIYDEFEKIIMGILYTNTFFLSSLSPIKIYANDLINKNTRYGVFETQNFIIKVDNNPEIFNSELEVMLRIGSGIIHPHNIVLPYYVKLDRSHKKKSMHFSVQPRIKNTIALHKWIDLRDNRYTDIEKHIQLCITISKSILFMHTHDLVHGDIKPDNILIEKNTNTPYIIDFGLSGLHGLSAGTGGTKPFCCPETQNISMIDDDYIWNTNNKQYDLWSIAFIFSSIILFKTCYNYYSHYPVDYFTTDKYVKPKYLLKMPEPFRDIFMSILCKKSDINLSNFIRLLEDAVIVSSTV
jgi:serine/threonine protein kinase